MKLFAENGLTGDTAWMFLYEYLLIAYLRRYPDNLERVYETLSYFDTMNMAERITAKVFASVGLADPVCPALCYYATYNRIRSEKHICVYPFNEHDGARDTHIERELAFVRESGLLTD